MKKFQLQTKIILGSIAGLLYAISFIDSFSISQLPFINLLSINNENILGDDSSPWFYIPIAFAIWWGSVHGRSLINYLTVSFSFSVVFWAIHVTWLMAVGIDAYVLVVLVMSIIYGSVGFLLHAVRNLPVPFLWYTVIFIWLERVTESIPFGGFPWAKIAYASNGAPWVNLVSLGSTELASFYVLLIASLLIPFAGFIVQKSLIPAIIFGIVIVALNLYVSGLSTDHKSNTSINVALIQGSVPRVGLLFNEQKRAVLDNHIKESEIFLQNNNNIDLISWPENAIDVDPFKDVQAKISISDFLSRTQKPLLAGAVFSNINSFENSVVLFESSNLVLSDKYIKNYLVPFGEYIPFRNFLEGRIARLSLISKDFQRGNRFNNITLNNVKISPIICYEVAWSDGLRQQILSGGEYISVHTNNATYAFTDQVQQQLQITRIRAIESGREAVVSATTGISAHIDRNGNILWKSDEFVPQSHLATVKTYRDITFAIKHGEIIKSLSVFIVLLPLLLLFIMRIFRKK
jgi:apolipoprotein N-acyltransferase